MFKFSTLLLALFPILIFAQEKKSQPIKENDSANSIDIVKEKQKEQFTREEARRLPRDKEYYFRQCYQNVPPLTPSSDDGTPQAVNVDAFAVSGSVDKYIYKDDVVLTQGDKYLRADKITYFPAKESATAEGNVNFINGSVTLYADSMESNLATSEKTLYNTDYQFHGRSGRGTAEIVYDNGRDLFELDSSTYSACPPGDETWKLNATTFYIDNFEEVGSAWNAVLEVEDVPIFYFPYVSYPLTDKRKTGLLFPTWELSDINGYSYKQPIYVNIAPNMDATITPYYMQNRGTLLSTEYRYLFNNAGSGRMQVEYLADDKLGNDADHNDGKRFLFHWDHNITFAQHWNFNVRYNNVSDDYYFSDITTPYGDRSDNQLLQTAQLSYREINWNTDIEVRSFKILGKGNTPHKVMPKVAFSAYKPLKWRGLQLDWYSEVTKFTHDDDDVYEGTRVHAEPKLSLPLFYGPLFINTELKYMVSYYQQNLPEHNKESWYAELDETATRYIPSFKIHSGLNFERHLSAFGTDYKQTLVPQIQYLYVPYKNQDNIGLYDTTTMQLDYYGLFRDNRYSGHDRIADANQITVGLSSGFLNNQGNERMRFAVAQNFYLQKSKVSLPTNIKNTSDDDEMKSSILGEFDVNFDGEYFFHADAEWEQSNREFKRANSTFEKRWLYNTYAQLNYRYIAITDEQKQNKQIEGLVKQVGTKVNWSINTQWETFASYYYDVEYKRAYESIIGLKYQSCCWAIGLTYDDHMLPYYGNLSNLGSDAEREQSFKITFELMGLGGVGFNSGEDGLFDYGRPFYLQ